MASLSSINIRFNADLKGFSSQMQNVQRSLNKTGKQLQNIGSNLSVSVTAPLLGIGALAVKAAADMETLKTSLDTVFQGDSNASNKAFDEIKEFAATTPFQLDEVATAFIKLKNLGLDPSISALTSYGNTASALGKSLDQMIEAVADASVGEFERLKEFGIKAKSQGDQVSFTFQGVTTTVKKNAAQISEYLQGIGNVNFAGSIQRQAATFKGRLSTLRDNIAQAFASIGNIIITYITPLFDKLNGIIQRFQELSPTTKKWIVILGGIAAAVGPLLALAGTILPAILTGFTILTGPIGLIAAGLTAIGVIIYKNWQPIKKTLIDIANYFIDLYNESTVFRVAVEAVVATFKTLWEIGKFVFEGLKSIIGGFIDNFVTGFKTIGKIIKAVFTGNLGAIPAIIKEAGKEGVSNFKDMTTNLGKDWNNLIDGIKTVTNDGIDAVTSRKKIKFLGENIDATAITDEVAKATSKGVVTGLQSATQSGGAGVSRPELTSVNAGVEAEGIVNPLGNLLPQLQEDELLIKQVFTNINQSAFDFSEQLSASIQEGIGSIVASFGDLLGSLFSGGANLAGLFQGLMGIVAQFISGLGKAMIQAGLASVAFKKVFANPVASIAAGAALIALSSVVKNLFSSGFAGSFANGGVVGGSSYYGDKLFARVNSGEAIFNRDQQRKLYSLINPAPQLADISVGGAVEIAGDKLRVVLDRSDKKQKRLG